MCSHVFGKENASNDPDCIFVWKVPAKHGHGEQQDGLVCKAIQECRNMTPKQKTDEL